MSVEIVHFIEITKTSPCRVRISTQTRWRFWSQTLV